MLLDYLRALRLTWTTGKFRRRRRAKAVRYFADRKAFVAAGGQVLLDMPMLDDASEGAGSASGHYFHQDLLVATKIHEAAPRRHIDVGSRVDGFVAHVAAFRPIEVIDIRPLPPTAHPNISFLQGDLMDEERVPSECCDSVSCLHALEHFGLGRYGDPIDPLGHLKGFKNLVRMLQPGGRLYLSFPIGRSGVHFNAHRVFEATEVLEWSAGSLVLDAFDYVDDSGDLHRNASPSHLPIMRYGCGIYSFVKLSSAHSG